jgi:hypothetical protein
LGCDKDCLISNEQYFIDSLKPFFNINLNAKSRLGMHVSEETKQKLRDVNLGKKASKETRKKMSESNKGKRLGIKMSLESRMKMSNSQKGKKTSPETIAKIVAKNTGQKRHPHTEETKRKIGLKSIGRKSMLGKKMSEESKLKLSLAHKGKKFSLEHRNKIGQAGRLRTATEETKQRMREGWIIRKQKVLQNEY